MVRSGCALWKIGHRPHDVANCLQLKQR